MSWFRRLVCPVVAAAAAVLAAGSAPASPAGPPELLPWAHGLEAAQADAKARNVPLLVVLNMDGERGNEAMLGEVYALPEVREAARKCAVTIASIGKHAEVADPASGRRVCAKFGQVTCGEHRATEEVVRKDWLHRGPNDDVDSPRHIFRAPDGRLLFERVWTLDAKELVKLIDRAVLACEPATLAAWDTTAARVARVADPIRCVREAALRDLVAAKDPAIDAQLFDLAKRSESDGVARDVLGAMAADLTPTRADGMRKLLAAPQPAARMQAAAALVAQPGKESFDALCAAYAKEKEAGVKCVLVRALAAAGGDPAKARDLVLKAAKSADPPVRVHAIVALAQWAKDDAVVEALRKLPLNEKMTSEVRCAACWTLGLSGRKELAAEWKPLAEERDESLKRVAKGAAAQLAAGGDPGKFLGWRPWLAPMDVWFPEPGPT